MIRTYVALVPTCHPVRLVADGSRSGFSILNKMAVEIVKLIAGRGVLCTLSPFES